MLNPPAVVIELPGSVAEQLTVVVPIGNELPDDGEHVMGRGRPSPSTALAEKETVVEATFSTVTTIELGRERAGVPSARIGCAPVRTATAPRPRRTRRRRMSDGTIHDGGDHVAEADGQADHDKGDPPAEHLIGVVLVREHLAPRQRREHQEQDGEREQERRRDAAVFGGGTVGGRLSLRGAGGRKRGVATAGGSGAT